ncbi:transglycosylase SLT domain-containing protein [Brevirhabdus sp.]|uniref:transglycosylase SLT domain-containing protein n=1 Tax=Brevirhabdus sp. TaxID=2004514 RepID=UPI0040586531
MANRQSRDPGRYAEFDARARVDGVPDFAVDTGAGARALANVAGSLSSRLKALADQAAAREGALAGLSAGQRGAAGYLQARAAETIAEERRGPPDRAQVNAPPAVRDAIVAAAQRHGVDPGAMLTIAGIESSFNPKAKNPKSSAGGVFQFIDETAAAYGLKDRYDPVQAADAAARLARDNTAALRKVLGRDPTAGELYLAHQQGAGGASKLLASPNARAVDVLGRDKVLLNGGTETMLARDFANEWISKANGGGKVSTRSGLPQLSDEPLQLRRDGTIRGEAFDTAATRAYGWRVEQGLSTDLSNAYEELKDDPAAFSARLGEIRDYYLQDDALADPEARETFERAFAGRARGYALNVASRQEARLKAEEAAAVAEGLDARAVDIERQAHALGANPEGDAILADQLARSSRAVDAAVEAGTLSPAQGAAQKSRMAETAARARVQGVFDNLASPGEKEQFALSLLEDWQSGEGPLAKLPFATVKALSQTLYRDARAEANASDGAARVEKARIRSLLDDDVASIEATGKPLDLAEAGADLETVQAALTPVEYEAWQERRDLAGQVFEAVSGMETLSTGDIEARLSSLAPVAGEAGFANGERVLAAAEKRAREIGRLRERDPALAVEQAFPGVAEIAAEATPDDPDSLLAVVDARLGAQAALEIPEMARQPLTLAEASDLARSVVRAGDARAQSQAMQDLVGQVQGAYGRHSDAVLRQVLEVQGIDRRMAEYGAGLFSRMSRGDVPTAADRRQGSTLAETAAAERASTSPPDAFVFPPYRAMQLLLDEPALARQFDEKYGAGAAERVLSQRREDPYRRRVEGGVEFTDETGEGFIPDE